LVPVIYEQVELVENEDQLWEGKITDRGEGGFGSTGTK
jgi:dUTPase